MMTTSVPVPEDLRELSGIDTTLGLSFVGDDAAVYRRILCRFRDDLGAGFPAAYRAARACGDASTANRLVHSMKGMARTIGAVELGERAARLESATLQADSAQLPALEEDLAAELARVLAGLALVRSREQARPVPAGPASPAPAPSVALAQFDKLLATGDTEAAFRLVEFRRAMAEAGWPEARCEAIRLAVERYDFMDALRLLREQMRRA